MIINIINIIVVIIYLKMTIFKLKTMHIYLQMDTNIY